MTEQKQRITIQDIIEKKTTTGKLYWSVHTLNDGVINTFDREVYATLREFIGKSVVVGAEQNERGFWAIKKVYAEDAGFVPQQPSTLLPASSGYAKNDKKIIRQSCLKAAIEAFPHCKDTPYPDPKKPLLNSDVILSLAEKFEAWVNRS